jgi:hypothetical protein
VQVGWELQGEVGKKVRPPVALPERKIDGKIGTLEKTAFSFKEILKQQVEVRGGDGEGRPEEVLDAMLNLMSEHGWDHDLDHV